MCAGWKNEDELDDMLRDPLIRLMMDSDGVTEEAMLNVMRQLRHAIASREATTRVSSFNWRA